MVFKLIVVLALLMLISSAQRPADDFPLNRWDLYKYEFIKDLVYKKDISITEPNGNKHDCLGGTSADCGIPPDRSKEIAVIQENPISNPKRAWGNIDLNTLLRILSDRMSEPEIYVRGQFAKQKDK